MSEPTVKAKLTPVTDDSGKSKEGTPVDVHFNPESLAITIRNQMEKSQKKGQKGRPPQQLVSSSEVTLAVQLVFDTTMTGTDVRATTSLIAEMMRPGTTVPKEKDKRRPAVVKFTWADFAFQGIITDYAETLDFFSQTGVPLRASLNLSITRHEDAFPKPGGGANVGGGAAAPTVPVSNGDSIAGAAQSAGFPDAANDIASGNGVEDIRNPEVEEVASPGAAFAAGAAAGAFGSPLSGGAGAGAGIGIGAEFGAAAAAFASGDAGFGLDLGLSAGVSVGAGASVAAGASLGGGAGFGAEAGAGFDAGAGFGAVAGASFGADGATGFAAAASTGAGGDLSLDAFAGLNPPPLSLPGASLGGAVSFDLPDAPGLSGGLSLSAGAGVSLGGAAGLSLGAGAGMGAGGGEVVEVGKTINLADILFKEEA